MKSVALAIAIGALASSAWAQEFEVVSVKPNKSESNSSSTHSDQGRLTATNVSLKGLIMRAYDLKDYQVEGPDWLASERFDVVAKFPEALPKDRERYFAALNTMLQKMLSERFKLSVRREQKVFPVFGLVIGKSGIKFKEVPDGDSHNSNSNNTHYTGTCVTMSVFAEFLARRMDRPVLDMTGLKAFYDLKLDWARDSDSDSRQSDASKSDGPSISSASVTTPGLTFQDAIQEQLGLKLESRKAPLEILIVDHAEKIPTEN